MPNLLSDYNYILSGTVHIHIYEGLHEDRPEPKAWCMRAASDALYVRCSYKRGLKHSRGARSHLEIFIKIVRN